MAVSKRLRYEIFRRDNHQCRYCGLTALENELTVDHVTPTALGGSDQPENLVTACRDCNAGKSASSPDAPLVGNVSDDALRWAAAMAKAAEMQAADRQTLTFYFWEFQDAWAEWGRGEGDARVTFEDYLPSDYERTLELWHRHKITVDELKDAIRIAMTKPKLKPHDLWRYCCGVIWRSLEDRQRIAREILDGPAVDEPAVDVVRSNPLDNPRYQESPFPNMLLLLDQSYDVAEGALAIWPDITEDEILWGYPRFAALFGSGLRHQLVAAAQKDALEQWQIDVVAETLSDNVREVLEGVST